jgi:hypothetical protein
LEGLAAGSYTVGLDAAGLSSKDPDSDDPTQGKLITLAAGEAVEGIDLEVLPGGVITGRVTDARGRPIIAETVYVTPFQEGSTNQDLLQRLYVSLTGGGRFTVHTDDRGIYRAYGLPEGRYRVSIGEQNAGQQISSSSRRVALPLTYYSREADGSRPSIVELTPGAEVANVDISVARLSGKSIGYTVSGRIVDQAGRPLPKVSFYYRQRKSSEDERSGSSLYSMQNYGQTSAKGEFTINGLPPGRYSISVTPDADSPWYSDDARFDVSDADIEGLEIKTKPAGSISGIAVLDGANDAAAIARFSQLKVGAGNFVGSRGSPIGKDGSFKITAVATYSGLLPSGSPGAQRVHISIDSDNQDEGFQILRVERDGVEQPDNSLEVAPGENVSGVRLVVACYRGTITGRVTIQGGLLPAGSRLEVWAYPVTPREALASGANSKFLVARMTSLRQGTIDARGRFVIQGLRPDDYEVEVIADMSSIRQREGDNRSITVSRRVTVTGDSPVEVSLVLDLSKKP